MSKGSAARKGRDDMAYGSGWDRVFGGSVLTKEQWLERCTSRFMSTGGMSQADAKDFAEAQFEASCTGNASEWPIPEESADEDMSYWGEQ